MRSKKRNIILSFAIFILLLGSANSVFASASTLPTTIYESIDSEQIASGIVHEHIERFTTSGWMNINVIRVDLKNEYTDLKGIFNKNGIPNSSTVTSLVDSNGAVAGINGDYFNFSPMPSAMGTLINDGEMISSPVEAGWALPNIYMDYENNTSVDYIGRYITVTNEKTNYIYQINTINKVTKNFDTPTVLDRNWGSKSIGTRFHRDLVELVVEDNIVKDIRYGQPAVTIPENGFVVAVRGQRGNELRQSFNVGDEVRLRITTTPDLESIKFAIGGGSIILKDGTPTLTNINSAGLHPRTGMGVNKDNTEMILVTIDGRHSTFKGIGQKMFGALLKDLGAHNGINLDGGGSTTMAVKSPGATSSRVVNIPSGGSQRRVVNGVGVFSNAPEGVLDSIKLSCSEPTMFKNTRRNLQIEGFDGNMKNVEIDNSKVELSVEGIEAELNGFQLIPKEEGTAVITAKYEDLESKTSIKVLGDIKNIYSAEDTISVDANGKYNIPHIYAQDRNGISARLYLDDVELSVSGNVGNIKNNVFIANDNPQNGVITARAGAGVENIFVSGLSTSSVVESFENLDNFSFSKYPEQVTGSISHSEDAKDGSKSLKLSYNLTNGSGNRAAYINTSPNTGGLSLGENVNKLGLWVKGNGDGAWLRANIVDADGKTFSIDFSKAIDWTDWKYVNSTIPREAKQPVKLQRIYVVESNEDKRYSGEILIDGLSAYYPSNVKPEEVEAPQATVFKDELEGRSEVSENGFKFSIFSQTANMNNVYEAGAYQTLIRELNQNNKVGISLNGLSTDFRNALNINSLIDASGTYSANKHDNVYFVHLDTKGKGITSANSYQWTHLNNIINERSEKHIVVTSEIPIFGSNGFKDQKEANILHEKLVELKDTGKNVFVVHGGSYNTQELKDGIRYIGINSHLNKNYEFIKHQSIVEFVVNGDNINYHVNPIFR